MLRPADEGDAQVFIEDQIDGILRDLRGGKFPVGPNLMDIHKQQEAG